MINLLSHAPTIPHPDIEPSVEFLKTFLSIRDHQETIQVNSTPASLFKMLAQSATRARMASTVSRRGFHTTRPQMASPFHYPEGPRTNLPFNPLTKHFFWRYWAFMGVGFGIPFGIAAWQINKTQ
ncbi:elongator complex protein 1 [Blastomyces dermatitidis ER-3]|uniref:Elongator complex protein 1 n=1 Tax=Ajellomyces dermatitidis (strain ER-3 / ATCC MYA-2586) TaxID=559297 RepID=A0ABP2EXG8_AJEDR|nr:elongator complex protein 1 [Blastomyces dermatitidis ER-3]EEQ87787.2 elongator complex protein 1 [Blastomyces dermatitidis ER-3]